MTRRRCCRPSPPMPPASWCARSARWCSGASATSSAASTRSWSPSSVMGASTVLVGLLPDLRAARHRGPDPAGHPAPAPGPGPRRRVRRGGDLRGRARARPRRGSATSWIQTTATLGFFLSLLVIGVCPAAMSHEAFTSWGWRIPFLLSLVLLVFSVYIRLRLEESPVFQRMKAQGQGLASPLADSFLRYPNNKYVAARAPRRHRRPGRRLVHRPVLRAVLPHHHAQGRRRDGLYAGRALAAHRDAVLHRLRRAVGPDRAAIKIILAGCLLAALTYFPLFRGLTHYVNPALERFQLSTPITVAACGLHFHVFVDAEDRVHRLRPGEGFPHQGGPVVRVAARDRERGGHDAHRRDHHHRLGPRPGTRQRSRPRAIRRRRTSPRSTT